MDRLVEYDMVRIVALHGPPEDHLAVSGYTRLPRVGDVGSVVHLTPPSDALGSGARYIVEDVAPDGTTVWLAEFSRDELELLPRPDGSSSSVPA